MPISRDEMRVVEHVPVVRDLAARNAGVAKEPEPVRGGLRPGDPLDLGDERRTVTATRVRIRETRIGFEGADGPVDPVVGEAEAQPPGRHVDVGTAATELTRRRRQIEEAEGHQERLARLASRTDGGRPRPHDRRRSLAPPAPVVRARRHRGSG